jgi:hypothetical protein
LPHIPDGQPETWVFDPETMSDWERRKPVPSPMSRKRYGIAFDQVSRRIIMHGGDTADWQSPYDTWAYDVATNTWTPLPDLGDSRTGSGPQTQARNRAYDYDSEHDVMVIMSPQERCTFVYRIGEIPPANIDYGTSGTPGPVLVTGPNPFNGFVNIRLHRNYLPGPGTATAIRIYTMQGRLVKTLGFARQGNYLQARWDASDHTAGSYLVRTTVGERVFSRRITCLK